MQSAGDFLHVFINGQYSGMIYLVRMCNLIGPWFSQIKLQGFFTSTGSAFGSRDLRQFTFTGPVDLKAGTNKISLLSMTVGLPVRFLPRTRILRHITS